MCSTGPFQFRWLKGCSYSSCYYHHQIGSIHLSIVIISLRWRHNGHVGISNHQFRHCLLNRLFGQRKYQSSASLAFVWGVHRWPVNSPHKWPVTRKMFSFDDVIMFFRGCVPEMFVACILLLIAYTFRKNWEFPLLLCSLWWVQIVGYVLAWRSYSFICTLHRLIIIIVQTYLKTLNL